MAVGKTHPKPIDASGKKLKFNPGINSNTENIKEVNTPSCAALILICFCKNA